MQRSLTFAILACLLGLSAARAEGPGIKLGESLVLHPGFALIAGHDSNVLYSASSDESIMGAYVSLRPTLDLSTLSKQRGGDTPHNVDFRLHAGSTIRFLITGDQEFNKQHIGADVDASALLSIMPQGTWSLDVFDNYTRTSIPPYYRVRMAGNMNFDQNAAGLRLRFRPGGGRLDVSLMYQFGLYAFESDAVSQQFKSKNHYFNDFLFRVMWRFFPKTAIYISAQETIYTYYADNGRNTPPSSYPLRVLAGLTGLITPTLTVDVGIGYGNGFYPSTGPSPESVQANVGIKWRPTATTAIGLGYRHDFNVALIGWYYDLDAAHITLNQMLWRFIGTLWVRWEERRYQGPAAVLAADGQVPSLERRDDLVALHLDITYPIRDWLMVSIGDDLQLNFSNCQIPALGTVTPIACDYKRNDVWGRISIAY